MEHRSGTRTTDIDTLTIIVCFPTWPVAPSPWTGHRNQTDTCRSLKDRANAVESSLGDGAIKRVPTSNE